MNFLQVLKQDFYKKYILFYSIIPSPARCFNFLHLLSLQFLSKLIKLGRTIYVSSRAVSIALSFKDSVHSKHLSGIPFLRSIWLTYLVLFRLTDPQFQDTCIFSVPLRAWTFCNFKLHWLNTDSINLTLTHVTYLP